MRAGHLALFFDGFDEIDRTSRKNIGKQIQNLAKSYDQNTILVSSRPDNEFAGWSSFNVFAINALTLDQACDLVGLLPFDTDLKTKFLKDLRSSLFEEHESFLSNPLLLSIMLLTYGLSADIPNKLNVFYNQAYEALFQRHDALKGAYQRDRSCSLDLQDYAKVFSAFSLQTYDKRLLQFSHSEAIDYLEKAKPILNISFDPNEFLMDALQSVCLLVEDGLFVTFSHRSFQEYFVARFICDSKAEVQHRLIERFAPNIMMDNVMTLLYEMNPELIETAYIIPGIDKLIRVIGLKKKVGITHYTRYIKGLYSSFYSAASEDGEVGNVIGASATSRFPDLSDVVSFTLRSCGNLQGWEGFGPKEANETRFWRKYFPEYDSEIETSDLTHAHEFIRELADNGRFFSKTTLELMIAIRETLIKKHKSADRSLNEILS